VREIAAHPFPPQFLERSRTKSRRMRYPIAKNWEMSSESRKKIELEIVHVLYTAIVSY